MLDIESDFAELFADHQWATFDAVWAAAEAGEIVRDLRPSRFTSRVTLRDRTGRTRTFYVKCHDCVPWKERLKAWARLRPLDWGAQAEWRAMHAFRRAGIPSMTPAAFGCDGGRSLVVSIAVEGCDELGRLIERGAISTRDVPILARRVGSLAGAMHRLGWQHQDFYLAHWLTPIDWTGSPKERPLTLIDLHRGRCYAQLPERCRVKDLGQLNYSAGMISRSNQLRFLIAYLGRRPATSDRRLIQRVLGKSRRVAAHADKGFADVAMRGRSAA